MNSTKQTILEKAKILFNETGYQSTTLRQIALELGMSQGNLNYHFKTKQDLLEALYDELVAKMNEQVGSLTKQFSILASLYEQSLRVGFVFYEYRFFLRDIYLILRENEKIRTHYIDLQKERKQQFMHLFELMIQSDTLRKEEFELEYERLYERLIVFGDNWINTAELFYPIGTDSIRYYLDLMFELFYPYLTGAGKQEFMKIFKKTV